LALKKQAASFSHYFRLFSLSCLHFFNKHLLLISVVVVSIVALVARFLFFKYPTGDAVSIDLGWLESIKSAGFKNFYTIDADYSDFFLFMVAIFSLLPSGPKVTVGSYTYYLFDLYYLKASFVVFDYLLGWAVYLIIKEITQDKKKAVIGYLITIALPVELLISSMWGNCDSSYVALFLFAIYFLLKKKDGWSWFFFGFALSIKMQAVFILPFFCYLWLSRKMKLYKIIYAVLALLLSALPTWFCGAGFSEPFKYLYTQAGRWPDLNYGCGNFWHFFSARSDSLSSITTAATVFGLLMIGVFTLIVLLRKVELTGENLITVAAFLIGIVPFFLPHMHERYFYALDVMVVLVALINKKHYYLIPMMQVSGGVAIYHYLSGKYFIAAWGEDSVLISSFINLAVLIILFCDIWKMNHVTDEKAELQSLKDEKEALKAEKPALVDPAEKNAENSESERVS
jgi:Gpi18-like mannosyltransferase